MPGMNGKDLANRMRSERPEMRVLYMSGYSENVIANERALGEDVDYISKPFSPQTLATKVRDLLHRPSVTR
jgi:DNA-binding NtrC family response regulator